MGKYSPWQSGACSMQGVVPYGPKTIRKYKHGWVATNYHHAGMEDRPISRSPEDLLGIVPSPEKGCQWWNATGKTWGMPLVGIWSTGESVVSSRDDK